MQHKNLVVKGKSIKIISYTKDGEEVYIPKHTSLIIDMDQMIALIGEDHVEVRMDEVEILLAN